MGEPREASRAPAELQPAQTGLALTAESTLEQLSRLAKWLLRSGCVPKALDDLPKVMLAVKVLDDLQIGYAAGISEVMVLEGKPAIFGSLPGACIGRTGKLKDLRQWFQVWREDDTPEGGSWKKWDVQDCPFYDDLTDWPDSFRAVTEIMRNDQAVSIVRAFSVAQAKSAGLWGKTSRNGKPTEWVKDPAGMLLTRSERRCQRAAFPEALRGVQFPEDFDQQGIEREAEFETIEDAAPVAAEAVA